MGTVVVFLTDGRTVDLSGLTAEAAVDSLRALGVTTADIARTVHTLRAGAWI